MTDLGSIRGQIIIDARQAVAAYAAVRAQNARTVYALRGAGDSFVNAGKNMAATGGVMVYAFSRVVKAAADFERKMDYFGAVTDTSARKMEKLGDYTLDLAEKTIYSAEQIADGIIELGKAGVSAEQIMGGIGDAMANLGAAGDIPLMESGQIITSTIQQFDLAAKDAVKVTDLLAGAANASIADITDIGVSLKYAGGVANAVGLSFEDTTTAISLLATAGIRGSTAGTSLRQMLVSFGGATKPAREVLREIGVVTYDLVDANKTLAKVTGGQALNSIEAVQKALGKYADAQGQGAVGTNKNAEAVNKMLLQYGGLNNQLYTSEGNIKSLSEVFQILQDKLSGYDNKSKLAYLRTIFNNRALSAASILTRDGAKGFEKMSKAMNKVKAADVAAERLNNLSGDIEILKGNIQTMLTRAGGPFQEMIRGWVQTLTKLIQKFEELDPTTQKNIIAFLGIGGAVLIAMGAISIIIGSILRFIAATLKMIAGLKFLWRMIRIVLINLKFLRVLLLGPMIGAIAAFVAANALIIAAIAAVVGILVLAYKYFKPFRDIVHSVADALEIAAIAVWNFLKLLVKDPGAAWEKTKEAFWDLVDMAKEAIAQVPGILKKWLNKGIKAIVAFGVKAKDKFKKTGSDILDTVEDFVFKVVNWFSFENVGYAIGYMVGTVVKLFYTLTLKVLTIIGKFVVDILTSFKSLPRKIGYIIGFLAGRLIGLFIKLFIKLGKLVYKFITGTIAFFRTLPGKIVGFLKTMATRAGKAMLTFAVNLPANAKKAYDGIVKWIKALPEKVRLFIIDMAEKAVARMIKFKDKLINLAEGMFRGFKKVLKDLPGAMVDITNKMIQAIKDAAGAAKDAVTDFAGGMWDGFKDGLGINSPSYMERAMWQITGVLDTETKKLARKTMEVQKLSKRMAATQFGVGGGALDTPGRPGYAGLASMHARNQNRARTLQEGSKKQRAITVKGEKARVITRDVTVNNPKPERAGQSVSKVLKSKAEEAGWR